MKNGDLSNYTYNHIVFDSALLYNKRVPRWRETLKMGKTEYNHPFMRYLQRLFMHGKPVTISMFCFKSEEEEVERVLQEHGLPITRLFTIDDYSELSNLPVIVERIISNELGVLHKIDRSLDYASCVGMY